MEKESSIQCLRCGSCCHVDMMAYFTPEDINRWETEGRDDILAHIRDNGTMWSGDSLITSSGRKLGSCVFLDCDESAFFCTIYETRPLVCRSYTPGSSDLCPLHHSRA